MASIENSLKYESEVEPGKIRLITSGEFVRADATERVPPVGAYTDATERVPPVGANPVATAADGGGTPSLPCKQII